ncbi:F-box protein At5g07610-like [Bidens hawaiensis]|uniref:F-box protein At5g07610-like n=1 Tax=Bidens hawaiensis TaxID=980011 RepID=UPI004049EFF3
MKPAANIMESTAVVSLELNPSTQIVISNDDLLTEILIRLPLVSLHVFKSISKRWCTLITNPSFTYRRTQNPSLDPASGLFIRRRYVSEYDVVPLDTRIPVPLPTPFTLDSNKVEILQSCNGLILCHNIKLDKFIVCNPSMKQFKTIPQSPYEKPDRHPGGSRIAFDPSKSTHYKIVCAGLIFNFRYFGQIQIYSSKTCEWSVTCHQLEQYDHRYTRGFNHGVYWNDAIHWLDTENSNWHSMLDITERSLKTRPQTLANNCHAYDDKKLFDSRGCLLLLCSQKYLQQLHIYEMSGWRSGWSLKYNVNLKELLMPFPNTYYSRVQSIVIGDKDVDSFLVMEMCGKIVRYNIGLKNALLATLLKIYELDSVIDSSDSFQFIASVAAL